MTPFFWFYTIALCSALTEPGSVRAKLPVRKIDFFVFLPYIDITGSTKCQNYGRQHTSYLLSGALLSHL